MSEHVTASANLVHIWDVQYICRLLLQRHDIKVNLSWTADISTITMSCRQRCAVVQHKPQAGAKSATVTLTQVKTVVYACDMKPKQFLKCKPSAVFCQLSHAHHMLPVQSSQTKQQPSSQTSFSQQLPSTDSC